MPRARPDAPLARVVSVTPGRVRLKVPSVVGRAAEATALARECLLLPGVVSAAANPRTASLLLRFRGEAETVLAAAERQGLFRVRPEAVGPAALSRAAPAASALLALLAALQTLRGAVLPPAVTLLWYAGSLTRGDNTAADQVNSTQG